MKKNLRNDISALVIIGVLIIIATVGYYFRQNLGFDASPTYTEVSDPGDYGNKTTFSIDKLTAVADGSDTITLTGGEFLIGPIPSYEEGCSRPGMGAHNNLHVFSPNNATPENPLPYCYTETYGNTVIDHSGTLLEFEAFGDGLSFNEHFHTRKTASHIVVQKTIDCTTGLVTTGLRSTVPGTVKIGATVWREVGSSEPELTLQVTFTSPTPPSSPPTNSGTSTNTTTNSNSSTNTSNSTNSAASGSSTSVSSGTSSNTASSSSGKSSNSTVVRSNAKPTTTGPSPVITGVSVSGQSQTPIEGSIESYVYVFGDPVTLSGTAEANSTINLFFYSDDPIPVSTKADEKGVWSYTYTDSLLVGDHRVDLQTVSADGTISNTVTIANFVVREKTGIKTSVDNSQNDLWVYGISGASLLVVIIIIILIIRRKKKAKIAYDNNSNFTVN